MALGPGLRPGYVRAAGGMMKASALGAGNRCLPRWACLLICDLGCESLPAAGGDTGCKTAQLTAVDALGAREASRDTEMVTTGLTGRGRGQASGTMAWWVATMPCPLEAQA